MRPTVVGYSWPNWTKLPSFQSFRDSIIIISLGLHEYSGRTGKLHYLWRAVDQDGDTIDILVQKRRNKRAAQRFFRKLLKGQCASPRRMVTDKLRSYSAARQVVMPSVPHCTDQYANNRAELSHEPTRQRERQMRRFKSAGQAQWFLAVHGAVGNLFRLGRHLIRASHYREFRSRAFSEWLLVTCG